MSVALTASRDTKPVEAARFAPMERARKETFDSALEDLKGVAANNPHIKLILLLFESVWPETFVITTPDPLPVSGKGGE